MTLPASQKVDPGLESLGSADLAPPSTHLLHGVTLRPPVLTWNGSAYCGPTLANLDADAALSTPGVVQVVVLHNFIGIVASQVHQAKQARARLHPRWVEPQRATSSSLSGPHAVSHPDEPASAQSLSPPPKTGTGSEPIFAREYTWLAPPASRGAAVWAIAKPHNDGLIVWASSSRPDLLRAEIAQLCQLASEAVHIISTGQPHDAYDLAMDAALLALHVKRAVRVNADEITQDHPLKLRLATTSGQSSNDSTPSKHDTVFTGNQYAFGRPSLAALLCGVEHHYGPEAALAPKNYLRDGLYQVQPAFASLGPPAPSRSLLAGQVFARESFFDEWCRENGWDPIQARLDRLNDPSGRRLIESVANQAAWHPDTGPSSGKGRGFAYAHVLDHTQEPPSEVWSAWIAEVEVNSTTGAIDITRLTVGYDAQRQDPAPASEHIETHVRAAATRWLPGDSGTHSPISAARQQHSAVNTSLTLPTVDLVPSDRSVNAPIAWSPQAELPAAAAIANAIYDATGIRLRAAPFNTDRLQGLAESPHTKKYKNWAYTALGGLVATLGSLFVTALPVRPAIAPVVVDTSVYSAAAIERGRLVAAAGDCMVCHTTDGGEPYAGGRALETPFGVIYTTNITPDKETGIGDWSYAAFERAMREGIHRDGRHLYPAFPYTSFAKLNDGDMQSLYAYLMTQPAVSNTAPKTELPFPLNIRNLVAGWNLLYHENKPFQADPDQSELWNRGAYLVQGAGHCAACHSPRNALGAEKNGFNEYLGGGFAEGWEAPPLNALSKAPIAWSEDALYDYLRTGYSPLHGVAAGPMAPIIQGLAQLPESDVRAMAHYLSSLNPAQESAPNPAVLAAQLEDRSKNDLSVMALAGEDLFQGACAVCHDARGGPPLFGSRPSLALNTNLHSDHPDNAIQVLLHGIADPTEGGLGYMPGFKDSMNDEQIVRLLEYMRARFARDKPAWTGLSDKVRELRETAQGG